MERLPSSSKSRETTERSRWYYVELTSNSKIFINESLCGDYRGLWNKCKRLKGDRKIHQFYTNNGIIRLKLVEIGSVKTIAHVNDLKDLFPDTDTDNL